MTGRRSTLASIRGSDDAVLIGDRSSLFERLFPWLLVGFAVLDRGFAWFHISGTPLFVTEIVLAVGLAAALRGLTRTTVWSRSSAVAVLVGFMAWGIARSIPGMLDDPEVALRDAATWIYAVFLFALIDLVNRRPSTLGRWLGRYRRLLLPLTVLLPAVVYLGELVDGLDVPDSDVSIFSYKPGNAAVHLLLAIGFLWAVWSPQDRKGVRSRYLITGLAVAGILVLSTQGRGGFVAATVGGALLILLITDRSQLVLSAAGSLVAIAVAVVLIDPELHLGGRDISAEQFAENVSSIVTGEGDGELGGNVDWRVHHWTRVWEGVNDDVPLTGHGFGVNIANEYGIPQADIGLRNAHNSHLTILARVGWVGAALWLTLWFFWYLETLWARRRHREMGLYRLSGLSTWALVGVTAIHVNAIFDPTLEGPQVAVWLWALTALGVFTTLAARVRVRGLAPVVAVSRVNSEIDRELSRRAR